MELAASVLSIYKGWKLGGFSGMCILRVCIGKGGLEGYAAGFSRPSAFGRLFGFVFSFVLWRGRARRFKVPSNLTNIIPPRVSATPRYPLSQGQLDQRLVQT